MVASRNVSLVETVPDADREATSPLGRPSSSDPVEARAALDAVAARMFGAAPQPLRVGRFVLLERIGKGGMGVVYAAYDPQLDRKIAIKLLTAPGEAAGATLEGDDRLIREARAAARLDHPNVVTIHEVGLWQGQVFLAMEFVDGLTLKGWLAARPRRLAETLEVFLQAGRGLAAAHAAGVVHRDFKPENVLVGRDGSVHVVDFGLARAPAPEPPHHHSGPIEVHGTTLGCSNVVMGTPAYMAPEQYRGGTVGPASDQFAFCVALWEAWFGTRPFVGDTLGALSLAVVDGTITAPTSNAGVPSRLRRILERGLANDPDSRYPSMTALMAALAHDPARRARRAAVAATLAGGLLSAGLVLGRSAGGTKDPCDVGPARVAAVWNDSARVAVADAFARTQTSYASTAVSEVQRELDAWTGQWITGHREACEATLVRREQSDELFDLRMACLDRRLAELTSLVELFVDVDAAMLARALPALESLAPVDACADAQGLRAAVPLPEEPGARAELLALQVEISRGAQLRELGRFVDAIEVGTSTVARAESLEHAPTIADAQVLLGSSQAHAGEFERARGTLESAVWSAVAGRNVSAQAAATIALVTITGYSLEKVDWGTRWGEHARAILRAQGDPPDRLATLEGNLGNLALTRGDRPAALAHLREAIRLYELSVGPEHRNVGRMLANLAVVLRQQGAYDLAEHAYARAVAILERSLGPGHPDLAPVLSNSGSLSHARGRMDEALVRYRAALAIGEASLEPDHPRLGHAHNNISETLLDTGDYAGAETHARAAIAIWERSLGPKHSLLASPYGVLGRSLLALGRVDDGIVALEHAIDFPPSSAVLPAELAQDRFALAQALWARPVMRERALGLAREAVATVRAATPPRPELLAAFESWLAANATQ